MLAHVNLIIDLINDRANKIPSVHDAMDDQGACSLSCDRRFLVVSRRICPHCGKSVSFKTFKAHKRLYYDSFHDKWLTVASPDESCYSEEPPTSFGVSAGIDTDEAPTNYYGK